MFPYERELSFRFEKGDRSRSVCFFILFMRFIGCREMPPLCESCCPTCIQKKHDGAMWSEHGIFAHRDRGFLWCCDPDGNRPRGGFRGFKSRDSFVRFPQSVFPWAPPSFPDQCVCGRAARVAVRRPRRLRHPHRPPRATGGGDF